MEGGPYKDSATKKTISGRNIYSVVAMSLYVWMKFHQGPRIINSNLIQPTIFTLCNNPSPILRREEELLLPKMLLRLLLQRSVFP